MPFFAYAFTLTEYEIDLYLFAKSLIAKQDLL